MPATTATRARTRRNRRTRQNTNLLYPLMLATNSEIFTWVPEERMLVTEHSSLPGDFGQVYADACDEGLTLVSQVTQARMAYVVEHVERRDGDLLWWDLLPADHRDRNGAIRVRVFND
jgi:hypothetical protein